MSDSSLLDRVQQQVADRTPVDWDALMAQLDAARATADERQAFSLLRLLDEVGLVHTSFQTGTGDTSESTLPSLDPVADDTLDAWGRYQLEEKVGRGGFGSVYRAWDPVLQMSVAIKILHRRFSDERLKERLLHEGRALAQIRHANVVSVMNVEQHDGRFGLVMEFVEGETLDALVARQGKLNDREASVIAEDVCRALVEVHAKGLLHRDVKARNIIRERAGRIVLMDFGAGLSTKAVQEQGRAVGTPLYMAPENLAGQPSAPTSDVYSVGVLLFYLVTGRHPYEGATVDEIRGAQKAVPPQSLLGLRPDLPMPFVQVVERATAADPASRYQTPADVLHALVHVREPPAVASAPRPGRGRLLVRWTAVAVFLSLVVTIGGLLSWATYNRSLGRGEFATDTVVDWLALGYKSLVLPVFLSLLITGVVGVLAAVRRVLLGTSARLRTLDASARSGCLALCRRLALNDTTDCGAWLFLITALVAVAIWWHWAPFLLAVTSYVASAPADTLAILSGPHVPYRAHYRMAMCVLFAANVAAWYGLTRGAAARRVPIAGWLVGLELSILVLLFASMQLPFRISHEHDADFPVLTWSGAQCFVVGERALDVLLVCPTLVPRHHAVKRAELPAQGSLSKANLFDAFAAIGSARQ